LPPERAIHLLRQVCGALAEAHAVGLIHRDIKPGNILFANAHTAKIVDFGLAVLQEHAGKVGGEVWGTPYYVAPEKIKLIKEAFRLIYRCKYNTRQGVEAVRKELPGCDEIAQILEFIEKSERGIIR
jgi:serine/threonine protein kinase